MADASESFLAHRANVQAKKRKRLELSSQLAAIKEASIQHVGPSEMESVLCVKHGALVVAQLQQDLKNVPPILPAAERKKLLEVIFRGLGLDYCSEEQNLILRGLANENITARKDQFLFLSPPVQRCIKCNTSLQCHNKPSEVMVYKMDGPMKALLLEVRKLRSELQLLSVWQ